MIKYICETQTCQNAVKQRSLWTYHDPKTGEVQTFKPWHLKWVDHKPYCSLCGEYVPQKFVNPKSHPDYEAGMQALR